MTIYTMGFTQKTAKMFFDKIKRCKIDLLVDIRLNNKSQLAGFTKGPDLEYFLKEMCNCDYVHAIEFAPTKEILDDYKKGKIDWKGYEDRFIPLMKSRGVIERFVPRFSKYENICLLCSEPTPEKCHRRLVAELIKEANNDIDIIHI